jgi:hypothetical protein
MTLIDIVKLALSQMGEDTGVSETDEYGTLLTAYINEAYLEICREKKHKFSTETLAFLEGRADISSLSKDAVSILEIKSDFGAKVYFEIVADKIFLIGSEDSDYTVEYLYLPERLSEDTDEPDIKESECYLLADFATYRGLSLGSPSRQKRAEFFLMRYLSGYSSLGTRRNKIVNKF